MLIWRGWDDFLLWIWLMHFFKYLSCFLFCIQNQLNTLLKISHVFLFAYNMRFDGLWKFRFKSWLEFLEIHIELLLRKRFIPLDELFDIKILITELFYQLFVHLFFVLVFDYFSQIVMDWLKSVFIINIFELNYKVSNNLKN